MEGCVTHKGFYRSWILVVCTALIVRAAGNIFLPSLSYMAADLKVNEADATSNLKFYYAILALSYILMGPVCDRYPKSKLLRAGLAGCAIGCIFSALAPNIHVLNAGRSIQALSAGATMLSSQLWIGEHSDKKKMLGHLSWFSMAVALAPLLSPVLGGCIADWLSWRYDFWLTVALSIPVYLLALGLPKENQPMPDKHNRISLRSIFTGYKKVLLHSPLERMSLSIQALFWGQSCFIAISSFLFINEMGLNATQLGFLNILFVCGLLAGRFPALYLHKRYSVRTAFMVNAAFAAVTSAMPLAYYFLMGHHDLVEIALLYTLQCIAFGGLSVIGIRNCIVVGKENKGSATGLYHFSNQLFSWLGVVFAQHLYRMEFSSVGIFQCMEGVILILSLAGIVLFRRAYSRHKDLIE